MKSFLKLAAIICLLAADACGPTQAANTKNNSPKVQDAKKQLDAAQDKLRTERQEYDKAKKANDQANAAQQAAAAELAKARQGVYDRHAGKIGLTAAAAERDAARQQVNSSRKGLQDELKRDPAYQNAGKSADVARERFSGLNDDKSLTEEKRQQLSTELAVTLRRPAEMEREREARDTVLQDAMSRFSATDRKVNELQAQLQKEMDADPAVKAASEKAKDAADRAAKARAAFAREQQQLNSAQAAVSREQQQYQQAENSSKKKKKG